MANKGNVGSIISKEKKKTRTDECKKVVFNIGSFGYIDIIISFTTALLKPNVIEIFYYPFASQK